MADVGMGSLSHPIPPGIAELQRGRGCRASQDGGLGNPQAGLAWPGWSQSCGAEPRYPSNCRRRCLGRPVG